MTILWKIISKYGLGYVTSPSDTTCLQEKSYRTMRLTCVMIRASGRATKHLIERRVSVGPHTLNPYLLITGAYNLRLQAKGSCHT